MSNYEEDINRLHKNETKRERYLTQGLLAWVVIYVGICWFFAMDLKLMFIIGVPSFLIIFWLIKIYMTVSLFSSEVKFADENRFKKENKDDKN